MKTFLKRTEWKANYLFENQKTAYSAPKKWQRESGQERK